MKVLRYSVFCEVYANSSLVLKCYYISGELTLGENIADNGGINTAFKVSYM